MITATYEFEHPTRRYLDARGEPCPRRHATFDPCGRPLADQRCCRRVELEADGSEREVDPGRPSTLQYRVKLMLRGDAEPCWYHGFACTNCDDGARVAFADDEGFTFLAPEDPDFWVGPA